MSSIRLDDARASGRRWLWLSLTILIPVVVVFLLLPRVASVTPTDERVSVPLAETVVVEFNWPMNRGSVEQSFQVNPDVPGELEWQGTRMLFTPDATWPERQSIEVVLGEGARSALGLPLLQGFRFSFTTSEARVLYAWPQASPAQLFRSTLDRTNLVQLTDVDGGIHDYDASPLRPVAYLTTAPGPQGNEILRLDIESGEIESQRSCPADQICSQVAVSPEGRLLAFSAGAGDPESESWSGQVIVIDPAQPPGEQIWSSPPGASSPDWVQSDLLAVIERGEGTHVLMDLSEPGEATERARIPDELGQSGTWSPDGTFWVGSVVDYLTSDPETRTEFFSHLVRVDVSSGSQVDLTGRRVGLVEDGTPAYSPDGSLLAFGRKYLDAERWTLGRQIWVMRADGSQARPITDLPIYHHSGFVWSPDGTRLLAQRFDQADPTTPGDIGWVEIETGSWTTLAEGAYLPRWTP